MSWVCEMPGRYNNSIQTTAATIASATIDQKIRNTHNSSGPGRGRSARTPNRGSGSAGYSTTDDVRSNHGHQRSYRDQYPVESAVRVRYRRFFRRPDCFCFTHF
jgi:hypothetical protein